MSATEEKFETENAIISSADLVNQNGMLSGWVHLEYCGGGQGFGGLALYLPRGYAHHNILSHAGHWIWRVMEVAGVDRWCELEGKTVRALHSFSHVKAIGHITKDIWFSPQTEFVTVKAEVKS